MKKTIIALFALAGVASADTISPITDTASGSWTTHGTAQVKDGVISATNTNWQVDAATYTLTSSLNYATTDTLSFSFNATNNGTGNSCLTLALIGSTNAIVLGHGSYDKPADEIQVAVTSEVSVTGGYVFANTNPTDDLTLTAADTLSGGMPASGSTSTISGSISWDGDSWALELGSSATSATLSYDLGITTLDVSKIMVTIEGGGAPNHGDTAWQTPTMSNLSISTPSVAPAVPEPTTATLSLLALAGLAARRRRK